MKNRGAFGGPARRRTCRRAGEVGSVRAENRARMLARALPIFSRAPPARSAADSSRATPYATEQRPATLVLDASRASDGIMEVRERIPAVPGPLDARLSEVDPRRTRPDRTAQRSGRAADLGGRHRARLAPRPVDLYAFHVDVPAGAQTLDVDFDVLMNAPGDVMSTHSIAIVNWNRALLYQDGIDSHHYFVKPSIVLPPGWEYATALRGAIAERRPRRLRRDAAQHARRLAARPGALREEMGSVARGQRHSCSSTRSPTIRKTSTFRRACCAAYERVPAEAFAMYGSRHFDDYHALLTLSDAIGFQGIEHHQSSDDRAADRFPDRSARVAHRTAIS